MENHSTNEQKFAHIQASIEWQVEQKKSDFAVKKCKRLDNMVNCNQFMEVL